MRQVALLLALGLGAAEAQTCPGGETDSTTWTHGTKKNGVEKNCAWAGRGSGWRCFKKSGINAEDLGVLASVACPVSCNTCPKSPTCDGTCCDSPTWLCDSDSCTSNVEVDGQVPDKDCDWVANGGDPGLPGQTLAWRCSRSGGGVLASEACPATCDTCPFKEVVTQQGHEFCVSACAAVGGKMPCVVDSTYNGNLQAYVSAPGKCDSHDGVWLGAIAPNPSQGGPENLDPTQWQWPVEPGQTCAADSTVYTNFAAGEPDNGGCDSTTATVCPLATSCSIMVEETGEWMDVSCSVGLSTPGTGACCVCDMT